MAYKVLKKKTGVFLALVLMLFMTACSGSIDNSQDKTEKNFPAPVSEENGTVHLQEETEPLKLEEIPDSYLEVCEQGGQVVRLDYITNTYDDEQRTMEKYAYVYLPYGYSDADDTKKYNVFYLMHGWTGEAELYLGGEDGDRPLKRIFDHLIANGDMEPIIVVTPTYYQDNKEKGRTVEEEDAFLVANFYQELQNDLIPAVESRYHTYAEQTDIEGIRSSRGHRIFGGFSMGAVTTWYTFLHCLDSFQYFVPISGDCWEITKNHMGSMETADETARYLHEFIQDSGYMPEDYYIYALTGTDDTAHDALATQIEAMKEYTDSFIYSDSADKGNLFFQTAEGGVHNYTSMIQYIYNALPVFSRMMRVDCRVFLYSLGHADSSTETLVGEFGTKV